MQPNPCFTTSHTVAYSKRQFQIHIVFLMAHIRYFMYKILQTKLLSSFECKIAHFRSVTPAHFLSQRLWPTGHCPNSRMASPPLLSCHLSCPRGNLHKFASLFLWVGLSCWGKLFILWLRRLNIIASPNKIDLNVAFGWFEFPLFIPKQWHYSHSIHLQQTFVHLYPAHNFIIIRSFEWT